jgi:hypothetical protein
MIITPQIDEITFDRNFMFLHIHGKKMKVSLEQVSSKLTAANEMQRLFYKISPSGYGIHWPLIDEDLSVEQLLKFAVG